ncbi:MAG: ubiquinone/menaquinone biosynthesis methyltransferase [Thermoanaerobaculales bacterium]|nr:ubiquinone/menaquinone biosynthesis methyltransferase [Thermoanaerobaculales bacterium]
MRRELLDKRSVEIRGMFGRIAHRYDLLNRVLSLGRDVGWRREIARRVAELGPRRVLDVCAGTGDVALGLAPGPTVVGADFSLPMLARARGKAIRRRRAIGLTAADALLLPFADESVDVVTVAFGVRNFEDLERGLAELVRVLAPGGTLLVLEFSRPAGPLGPLLGWWARAVPPTVGRILSGDREAYAYLPASVGSFADARTMCGILHGLGLGEVEARPLTGGVCTLYQGVRTNRRKEGE